MARSLYRIQIIMIKGSDWADEVAAKLHEDMPLMGRATEYVWHALRRSAQRRRARHLEASNSQCFAWNW